MQQSEAPLKPQEPKLPKQQFLQANEDVETMQRQLAFVALLEAACSSTLLADSSDTGLTADDTRAHQFGSEDDEFDGVPMHETHADPQV